jgi:hypothetical protein
MHSKAICSLLLLALVALGPNRVLEAAPIAGGTTSWLAKAIQDVTLFANTSVNPSPDPIFIDDLFGIATAGINRETQVGDTIEVSSVVGWDFVGSLPGIGSFRFGIVGPFSETEYSGAITGVAQDSSSPGFASGDPASFQAGTAALSGPAFAFEFLSGPLAGVVLTTDPSQQFAFEASLDGLPPSVGTTFFATGDQVLNVFFGNELVGTSSDRRVVVIPEPTSVVMVCLPGLLALLARGSAARRKGA